MIERLSSNEQMRNARKKGVAPSNSLRPHFLSLARQVTNWAADRPRPVSIGVTSLESRAGRSTVSYNLAAALTSVSRERVVLVESDFGNQHLSKRLGQRRSAGLAELLAGTEEEGNCPVIETPLNDLYLLGCGQKSGQEALELPFESIPNIVQDHLGDCAFAVFDLPVASNVTACYSIAAQLDTVLLTVELARMDQRKINRFKKQMQFYGVDVLGVVLNKS